VLVDISVNNESGEGAKICVARLWPLDSNSWHLYPSVQDARKVLLAFGIAEKLIEELEERLQILSGLGSREPIDFLSVDVPEDVLLKYGFRV
jgi:hypothetical protein